MIAVVHSIYSQSVHAPALNAGLMDNDAERYCNLEDTFPAAIGICYFVPFIDGYLILVCYNFDVVN